MRISIRLGISGGDICNCSTFSMCFAILHYINNESENEVYEVSDQLRKCNVHHGNWDRICRVMQRASEGESLVIGFLGGSITMGSLSSTPQTCYAYHVYEWWCRTFPNAKFSYINAGIGATDSQFGCARAESTCFVMNRILLLWIFRSMMNRQNIFSKLMRVSSESFTMQRKSLRHVAA